MAERKVLVKYYPPDYDVSKIPRLHLPKNRQTTVRIMLPMSIQCTRCGEYIYKGKKFNGMKEEAPEHKYLTIKVWRFYFKCTFCLNEITFLTDPKNSDYIVEHGATRNTEIWKVNTAEEEKLNKKRKEEEKGDVMKKLENQTMDSKRELDIADAIEEVRERNSKGNKLSTEKLIDLHVREKEREEEKEIWEEAKRAFQPLPSTETQSSTLTTPYSDQFTSAITPKDSIEIAAAIDDSLNTEEQEEEGDEDLDPAVQAKRRELISNGLSFAMMRNTEKAEKNKEREDSDIQIWEENLNGKSSQDVRDVTVMIKRKATEDSAERKEKKKKKKEKKLKDELSKKETGENNQLFDAPNSLSSLLHEYADTDED